MEAEFFEGPNLSKQTVEVIRSIMSGIEQLANLVNEPMDPKVLPLLEVVHDILEEQIVGDKVYTWEDDVPDSDDTPSAEDLSSWVNGE